jgi:hypothetical protein
VSYTNQAESGYIAAYVITNSTNSTNSGASIRLGVNKLIDIKGSNTIKSQQFSQSQKSSLNTSISSSTTAIFVKSKQINFYLIAIITASLFICAISYIPLRKRYDKKVMMRNINEWEKDLGKNKKTTP